MAKDHPRPPAEDRPVYRFYGAERSYFTGKARPALRAKRVYFEEILPTGEAYRDIRARTGLRFIPVVVTPEDETWQDTSDIIDALERRFPEPTLIPATPVQRIVSYLLELYADEFLILPAMHYRWSAPESERDARGAFAALNGDPEAANRFADLMRGSLPMLGVVEASIPAIEDHLAELLSHMESVFAAQPFLLGGIEVTRYTSPYTLWMVQRPLDAYRALPATERQKVDRALADTGCEELIRYQPRHRLVKRSFKLAFAPAALAR